MKSLKVNYFFSILKSVMAVVFPLISFPYASRVLGVDNIGIVSYCTSVIGYFTLFAGLGVSIYATREGAKIREDKAALSVFTREVFTINIISTVIVYAIFMILLFAKTLNGDFIVMLICSLSVWFTTLGIEWLYQIEEEFSYISLRSMAFQIISLVLLFVLVRNRQDYIGYASIQVLASGGSCILNLIHSKSFVNWRQEGKRNYRRHIKPILIIFGISASSSIYINLDIVMLRIIHTDHEVGLYTAAVKVVNIIKQVINSLSIVLMARLSNYAHKEDKSNYNTLLKSGFTINMSMTVPCAVGMFMISHSILLILSGREYLGATTASQILAINVIFAILDGMIYYQILLPNRKEVVACIGTTMGAIMNLVLNALLIPECGINGAAVATVISELCVFVCFCILIRKNVNLKILFSEMPKIFVSTIPIIVVCKLSYLYIHVELLAMIVAIAFSGIFYFVVLKLVHGVFAEQIFHMIHQIIKRKK